MKKGVDYTGIAVTFMCHDGKGNLLLQKRGQNARDERGAWGPGGGGIEFTETAENAVRREVKEEYNLDALEIAFLGYRDVLRTMDGVSTHWLLLDFKVLVDPSEAKIGEPDMIEEIRWVTLSTIPEPMHSQFPRYLELHKQKLV